FELTPGQASSYKPMGDGGFVLFVEKFIPASDEDLKKDLAQFSEELRRRSAGEAFNDWFAHEMQIAQLQLPGDRMAGDEEQTQ
ncbi:MAG TPA: hypothetical protein VK633_13165, partial [Verrucomicrobiae bacterium]|nr:hypothetical protein [Verrucomicrobiae bacterium]